MKQLIKKILKPNEFTTDESISQRRSFFKYGLSTGGAALFTSKLANATHLENVENPDQFIVEDGDPSPPVVAWQETFPDYLFRPKATTDLNPPPQRIANIDAGETGRNPIPRYEGFFDGSRAVDYYELHLREELHVFNPAYPPNPIWGFDGVFPGPTIHARYGRPVVVRLFNELPQDHVGYGSPESAMHLHNMHASSESDGFPGDYFSPEKIGPTLGDADPDRAVPGLFKDHHYHNIYAGIDEQRVTDPDSIGDPREALGSLWYHDHTEDATAPNVVKGMLGQYFLYDALDSGDENDANATALRLPSGDFDVPIMLTDMRFDRNGIQVFDQLDPDGTFGDMIVVNGKIKPFFNVARRKYRLRIYDTGPSRQYQLEFVLNGQTQRFVYIANDGNLLERPLMDQTSVHLAVAERADIIFDFSQYPIGTEIYLTNFLEMDDSRKPDGLLDRDQGIQILQFRVEREAVDRSRVLTADTFLRELPPLLLDQVVRTRRFEFERRNGVWVINGQIFDVFNPTVEFQKGDAERWILENGGGGWAHPIHIHMEEGRILSINGATPPPHMRGRKDVYDLQPGDEMEIYIRFRDFNGKYVMHCHNVIHEDHAMMLRFDVVGEQDLPGGVQTPTIVLNNPVASAGNKTGYIEATVSANGTAISHVEFFYGNNLLQSTTEAPYRAHWENAPDGTYQLKARLHTADGQIFDSSIVEVVVGGTDNVTPQVVLQEPVANAENKTGYIEAIATDTDGSIQKVEFYYGENLWQTVTSAPYRAHWDNVPNGTYRLTARAYDDRGGVTTSNIVEVIVQD